MPNRQQYSSCVLTLVIVGVFVIMLNASGHINVTQREGPCSRQEREKQEVSSLIGANQGDPALAAYIRSRIVAPSVLSYNLTRPWVEHFAQFGQDTYLMTDLLNQTDGFFVEAGAADGELLSNTLFLERRLGWRGLLVEAFPGTYNELLFKRRKAYSLQAALSPTNVSKIVNFKTGGTKGVIGRIVNNSAFGVTVEAFPLYAILQALNVTVIDFLSLDVEGFELKVLKTVPWDKIKVRLMTVEWLHIPGGFKPLKDFMTSKGYRLIRATGLDAWFGLPELLDKPTKKY